jgi:hypothetical protein
VQPPPLTPKTKTQEETFFRKINRLPTQQQKHKQSGFCAGKLNLKIGCRHSPKKPQLIKPTPAT